jgi:hypothetical protein
MVRSVGRWSVAAALVAPLACACGAAEQRSPRTARTEAAIVVSPAPQPRLRPRSAGIWVSRSALRHRPTNGPAWDALVSDARADPGPANVADQDSGHDVRTLAAAFVCARTRSPRFCAKARSGVIAAIGTERGARWLAVGRNLTGYVIAADLLGLHADRNPESDGSRVEAWIRGFLTEPLAQNNTGRPEMFSPFGSGSNASAQEGAAYAAVAAYLRDRRALARAWDAFRTYVCAPGAPNREHIDLHRGVDGGWALDDRRPCAINPRGAVKQVPEGRPGAGEVRPIDGAIINDMARGGDYKWPPGVTQYPWVGLEGLVPAAVLLDRAGYPAFTVADRAVLRAVNYLWYLQGAARQGKWFKEKRENEIVHLINVVYRKRFPVRLPTGGGRTIGYTDWTYPTWPRRTRR